MQWLLLQLVAVAACWAAVLDTGVHECPLGSRCVPLDQCPSSVVAAASAALRPPSRCASAAAAAAARHQESVCCADAAAALPSPNARRRRRRRDSEEYRAHEGRQIRKISIIGGEPAKDAEFGYMVAIGYLPEKSKDPNTTALVWGCGGSLISDRYVLTAAHCITDARRQGLRAAWLRLGVNHLVAGARHEGDVAVEATTLHPGHHPHRKYLDLALLRTARPVRPSRRIAAACLPDAAPAANQRLVAAGWGATDAAGWEMSPDLKKAELQLVPLSACKAFYPNNTALPRGLDQSMLCAAEPQHKADTCRGDSGGPLVSRRQGCDVVVGVMSFGGNPCADGRPAVFADVRSQLPWVQSIARPRAK